MKDQPQNEALYYDRVAMSLHWLVAIGIMALIVMGLLMVHGGLTPDTMFRLYQLHKSVGITILLAALCRLGWRLAHRPPALPGTMPLLARRLASGAHALLYTGMIGLPLSGWAVVSSSAFAVPTVLFNVVRWPDLPFLSHTGGGWANETLFSNLHAYGAYALIALIALHVLAALHHQIVLRDGMLARMLPLPGRKTR